MQKTRTLETAPEQLTISASDGYRLTAFKYPARAALKGHLLIAGATGVPQRFYRRFAEHASARGFTTLTLDYRGIGMSRHASLKGFRADQLDWATLDLAAAVDAMASDTVPLFMVGHSFGGHALGLLPNHARVAHLYTFATGAGWHGWMRPAEHLRVIFMWWLVAPAIAWWKGYLAWSLLGMGEDLPLGVYRQWRRWCHFPHYFFDDPEMTHVVERYAQVRTPIVAANALDDAWAPPRSRDAFMAGYCNANWQAVDIDPKAVGLDAIGHMGYFRSGSEPLWQGALDWFEGSANRLVPSAENPQLAVVQPEAVT